MTPLNVGMYLLLGLGAVAAAAAIALILRAKVEFKRQVAAIGFAVLLLGLGTFGHAFMDPYTKLLGTLVGTTGASSDTPKYSEFFDEVANGKLDEEHAGVGIAHALSHPVPDMDKIVERAIASGSSDAGKQRLQSVLAALKVKESEADKVLVAAGAASGATGPASTPKPIEASRLDPGVRIMVEHRLIKLPPAELQKIPMDTDFRRALEARRKQ